MIELNKNDEIYIFGIEDVISIFVSRDICPNEYCLEIMLRENNNIYVNYKNKSDLESDLNLIKEKMKESRS